MKKKIPAAPVPAPKGFQKLSSFSKGMLIGLSTLALLLVIITGLDMGGFHLIWPEVIPMGCLLPCGLSQFLRAPQDRSYH